MQCRICKKESSVAICGFNKTICYHCIFGEGSTETKNLSARCILCEKQTDKSEKMFRKKFSKMRLLKNGDVICGECLEIAEEGHNNALSDNDGIVPPNSEYIPEDSIPAPVPVTIRYTTK